MSDLIDRQAAIDAVKDAIISDEQPYAEDALRKLPSAEPDNQVHLCNSCKYDYPECPVEGSDVIFGNGIGHDNVCACAKFEIKPERTTRVECIAEVYKNEIVDHYLSGICGICGESTYDRAKYCSECGAKLDWSDDE